MVLQFRVPGPLGWASGTGGGRLPGPLYYGPGSGSRAKATAAPSKTHGITVNPASEISGQEWEQMLKQSPDLPQFIEDQVSWAQDNLTIPAKFTVPAGTVDREWLPDYRAAFAADQWEVTTGHLDITATGDLSTQQVIQVLVPHLQSDESVDGIAKAALTRKYTDYTQLRLTFGETFEPFDHKSQKFKTGAVLKSKRGLIVVTNRVKLKLGSAIHEGKIEKPTMVESLVHEIAAHAGRFSQGQPDGHGDSRVDRNADDIHHEFDNSKTPTTTIAVHTLIEAFYQKGTKAAQSAAKGQPATP